MVSKCIPSPLKKKPKEATTMSDKKSRMAQHHEILAQHCADQAQHCEDMADATEDPQVAKCFGKMSETWKSMSKCHSDEAAGIMKSMGLGSAMQENRGFSSDGISGIAPPAPRAIPRIGQPQDLGKAAAV